MHGHFSLEATLTRAWRARGPLACALWPVARLFGALAAARRFGYARGWLAATRLPVPVIVVGNIYVGGTGKTPLTIWLVEALRAAGYTPGVISRGHGRADSGVQAVDAASRAAAVGDEPVLIARRTGAPVLVGRARAAAGRALLAAHPQVDVLIADDGLQHYALARDLEIVLFDSRGAGNGWLLPAGPLREPRTRARDVTIVNAPALPPALAAAVGGAPWQMQLAGTHAERLTDRAERVPLAQLAARTGPRLAAAAGIGHPERFFAMLRAAGLEFTALALPDHYDFATDPFAALAADAILITEKDAVKCAQLETLKHDPRLWVVPVAAQLDPALARHIVEKMRGRPPA